MQSLYGKGKACVKVGGAGSGAKDDCKGIDAASKVLQKTRKADEALAIWKSWHDSVGRAERDLFGKFVPLANSGAKGVGFKDVSDMWKSGYDMPADAFEADTDRLWGQMKPLYDQLHCYTRRKLNKIYGDKVQPKSGPIMAHITGNMWAQSWDWLYKDLEPYPGQSSADLDSIIEKTMDEKAMVRFAEAFYTSLGFPKLPETFWERSMFQKPAGKEAVCHASAWDVTYDNDLRIKMCIQKTEEELGVIHHELGHNYYFAAYYKLPMLFQNGANDGFHEAIGDTIVLSMTPNYYKERGLLKTVVKNDKATINNQMKSALAGIAFAPFGLVVDKWRWDVFAGKVAPDKYNEHWWELRKKYQGVVPPIPRAATDFDPGAKYHVPGERGLYALLLSARPPVPVPSIVVREGRSQGPAPRVQHLQQPKKRARRSGSCCRPAPASRGRTRSRSSPVRARWMRPRCSSTSRRSRPISKRRTKVSSAAGSVRWLLS